MEVRGKRAESSRLKAERLKEKELKANKLKVEDPPFLFLWRAQSSKQRG
jgi:hypothetical protein